MSQVAFGILEHFLIENQYVWQPWVMEYQIILCLYCCSACSAYSAHQLALLKSPTHHHCIFRDDRKEREAAITSTSQASQLIVPNQKHHITLHHIKTITPHLRFHQESERPIAQEET